MATPITSAREFCALLAKSKLLPAGEADALLRAWQAETGGADALVLANGRMPVAQVHHTAIYRPRQVAGL